jgi:hypothetical protein
VTFLAKLSNEEIYFKNGLWLELIKSNCPIGDVLTPLNCCKVLAGNSYNSYKANSKQPKI